MIEGIDVPAIEAKIAKYQEENAEQIMINRARKVLQKKKKSMFPSEKSTNCFPEKWEQYLFASQGHTIKFYNMSTSC